MCYDECELYNSTDRGVVSTRLFATVVRVVMVVPLLVEPVLDRFVRDRIRVVGERPDVLANRRKAVVFGFVRVGRAMFVDATISPFLSQLT